MLSENAKNRAVVNRSCYSLRCLPLAQGHGLESSLTVCGWIKPCVESKAKVSHFLVCNQFLSMPFPLLERSLMTRQESLKLFTA